MDLLNKNQISIEFKITHNKLVYYNASKNGIILYENQIEHNPNINDLSYYLDLVNDIIEKIKHKLKNN